MIEVYIDTENGLEHVGRVMGPSPPQLANIFTFHLVPLPGERYGRALHLPVFRGVLDGEQKTVLVPTSLKEVRQIRRFEQKGNVEL